MNQKTTQTSISKQLHKLTTALLFSLLSLTTVSADELTTLTTVCAACHGANGISNAPVFPNLAGQQPIYMADQIKAMKAGIRKNSLMEAVIKDLSDQQIDALAEYYSSLPASTTAVSAVNQLGKNVRALCISCHGVKGISVNAQWPNLAGQKQQYLQQQLLAFRDDSRFGPNMQVIAKELNVEQIAAVAEYFSQQPGANHE